MKVVFIFILFLISFTMKALEKNEFLKMLPVDIMGWQATEEGIVYDKSTLYDYIDGGAELYISYNFINVLSRQYKREGQPTIYAEIFDMGTSFNAFGVFSNSKEKLNIEIGQGGQYLEASIVFWKDHFFISIYADFENQQVKDAMVKLAGDISGTISNEGKKPSLNILLPEENLKQESIVYFIHHAWQNYYHFISNDDIFQISPTNNAIFGRYIINNENLTVLLIQYANDGTVNEVLQKTNKYFTIIKENAYECIDLGNGTKGLLTKLNNMLILTFGNSPEKTILLSDQVKKHINAKNNGK